MRKTNLQKAFERNVSGPKSIADNIVSAADAVTWLQSQPRFEEGDDPKGRIHDFLGHILADAPSGIVADERRAAISEFYTLGIPIAHPYSKVENDRIVATSYSPLNVRELADFYSRISIEENLNQIQQRTTYIRKKFTGKPEDEILTLINTDEIIVDFTARNQQTELSSFEFEQTRLRAITLNSYFRKAHQGRQVSDFSMTEILAMPLTEFGITAIEFEGRLRFMPLIEIPKPVIGADIKRSYSGQGFSL